MGKGSNSSGIRRYNERVLLTTLRNLGSASKSDLAKAVNLTPQAVTRIVDDLDKAGLVSRKGRRIGGKGQPSIMYSVEPEGAFSIGVKVGRDDLEFLLMDFSGAVLERIDYRYEFPEPDFLIETIQQQVKSLEKLVPDKKRDRIAGIGIAMPWFIGAFTDEEHFDPDLARQWNDINFEQKLSLKTRYRVFLENDCSAAAIAELLFGHGITYSDFLYIFIGTFVGGGLVMQSKLEPGAHGNAGALASMPVPPSALRSTPAVQDNFDILLNRASLFGLRRHIDASAIESEGSNDLSSTIDKARPQVQEWMDDCADALAFAILSAVGILDIRAVVIDGELPRHLIGELVDMISRRVRQAQVSGVIEPVIIPGSIGADAVSRGGAVLPFYADFAPDKAVLLKGGIPSRVSV